MPRGIFSRPAQYRVVPSGGVGRADRERGPTARAARLDVHDGASDKPSAVSNLADATPPHATA
jgi:hypothetical protein